MDKTSHKTLADVVGGVVVLAGKILLAYMIENIVDTRDHLIFRQRHRVPRVEDRELRHNIVAEHMTDLLLGFVIGDDRAAVHLRACARHSENAADGNYLAGRLLKADKIFLPRVVVAVNGYRYCL